MSLKLARFLVTTAISLTSLCAARGQGTFQNLNFEQANVPYVPPGDFGSDVSSLDGVPFWTTYIGTNQVTAILHNNQSLGSAAIAILGPEWFPNRILEGSYTVQIGPSSGGPPTTAAIGQIGTVPGTAESVRFYGNGGFTVTFGGNQISLVALGSTANYTIYGGDITAYENQTGELRFQGGGWLDNILFSNQPIPEPGVASLLALSGLVIGSKFLRRRR